MEKSLEDRSGKVIIVDPSGAVRQMVSEVMKSKSFENIQAVANVKDAISVLEVEPVKWIITPLLPEDEINALQLLSLVAKNPTISYVRVSLMVEESELELLPFAFENGLMSYIDKPFNKTSLNESIDNLIKKFTSNGWNSTRVAAECLSEFLTKNEEYQGLANLYFAMLDIFPGDPNYLLRAVRPCFMIDKKDKAFSLLKQTKMLDPALEPEVKKLKDELFPDRDLNEQGGDTMNVLGIKNCVIVDSDSAVADAIKKTLEGVGITEISTYSNGEEAWEGIKDKEVSLLLQEWRIPKLSGPLFLQRLKHKSPGTPVVIISSLLTVEDMPIVKEMGVAGVIEKPFEKDNFLKKIVHTLQKERLPGDAESMELKIRQHLEKNDMPGALALRERYIQFKEIPDIRKKKIEAEFAYARGDFKKARDFAIEAIGAQTDPIMLLNLLGKSLMKLGDFDAALKCLQKAQSMSPMNIQRLCHIAEVNSELGDAQAAAAAIDEAKKKDAGSNTVGESEAKIALSEGDAEKARKIMQQLDSISQIVSFLNNKAVALARSGKVEESYDLYLRAIDSIPDGKKDIRAIVQYNLALAYTRNNLLDKALSQLAAVLQQGHTKVERKAGSLKKRLEVSKVKGSQVRLKEGDEEEEFKKNKENGDSESEGPSKHLDIIAAITINPGELCCFRLFSAPQKNEKATKMGAKIPHFTPREAIAREESRGADKTIRAEIA